MIRIVDRNEKRTKAHVIYEFDHEGVIYKEKASFKLSDYLSWTEQELLSRIRALAIRGRTRMSTKEEPEEEQEKEVSEE